MSTRMLGTGMLVSQGNSFSGTEKKPRLQAAQAAPAPLADFFSRNGIPAPSALFDELSDTYYFAKNKAGKFVWGNRLLQEKHGLAHADDVIGKGDDDFFRRDIAERIRADDLAVMQSEVTVRNKLEVLGGEDGALTWLFTTKAPLRNKAGEVIGVEGFSRDAQRSQDIIAPFHAFRSCIEYLQAHMSDDVTIEHLANLSCMSLSTFERKFKQHFLRTPKQYILHMKVHEACRLLPSAPIARVALETGFGGQSYFTKQFRSVVGITPKQYQLSVAAAAKAANRPHV